MLFVSNKTYAFLSTHKPNPNPVTHQRQHNMVQFIHLTPSKVHIPSARLIGRLLPLRLELLKVGQVHAAQDRLAQRAGRRAAAQRRPIEPREPGVRLDLLDAALLVADAVGRYLAAQVANEVLRRLRDARRHAHRIDAAQNGIVRAHVVLAAERRLADEQLVHEHAQCPVVDGPVVALVEDDLGRHVLGRAGERPRFVRALNDLGEAKVDLCVYKAELLKCTSNFILTLKVHMFQLERHCLIDIKCQRYVEKMLAIFTTFF